MTHSNTISLSLAMDRAVKILKGRKPDRAALFHHNDTDGLTSGTILQTALNRESIDVERLSLEKPYPEVLAKIFEREGEVIIFADFAGKIAPLISRLNRRRNLVLILDHHPAEPSKDDTVINLDGDLFGLKGDLDISASSTCYLFAKALSPLNSDLARLGTLGAVGDGFLLDGRLVSVNRSSLLESVDQGAMRFEETETGETYYITLGGKEYLAKNVCSALDTLGGVGYYNGGTDRGVKICESGFTEEDFALVNDLSAVQRDIFERELEILKKGGLHTTKHLQWFDVKERFSPMGVKMIGVFCSKIKEMDFLDHSKYLAGFQTVKNEIPGFGKINFNSTKISMRVSGILTDKIRRGKMPGLGSFLPEATKRIGGFADACHSLSAATTVKLGQEEKLISEIETVLGGMM